MGQAGIGSPMRGRKMSFDITSTAVVETAKLDLTDAEEAPLYGKNKERLSITLYGPGSEPFERASAKRQNRLLDRMRRKGKTEMSAEEQRSEASEFLASITVSFNGFEYPPAGEAKERELFKALYMDRKLGFITDQVQRFVGDWGNFSNKSATS
jgi:hypothetical protein